MLNLYIYWTARMIYPSKGSATTLYCGVNIFIGIYILWFDDLLTGESYITANFYAYAERLI